LKNENKRRNQTFVGLRLVNLVIKNSGLSGDECKDDAR